MDMVRIELPALRALRLSNVGTREEPMWVVTGPTSDVAAAVAAGGAWVLTRRGPRAVLVERVVTLGGVPAIVPQEPEFADATTRQVNVADMSTDMLRALLAEREAQAQAQAQDAPVAPVSSATERTTRKSATKSATKSASATKRTTRKSADSEAQDRARAAAAAAAVADVSDDDLRALLAQAQAQ